MTAYFSCAAYHHYEALLAAKKQLAEVINAELEDKVYGSIQFLIVQFSTLTVIEPTPPEIDNDHAVSMVVNVAGTDPGDLSEALMKGLDGAECVPEALRMDIKRVLDKMGWL